VDLAGAIERYLSLDHVDHPETGCPLAALGSDGGRQPSGTRRAFTRAVARTFAAIAEVVPRAQAIAAFAAMVGAVVLARAVADRALAAEILEAVRGALRRELG